MAAAKPSRLLRWYPPAWRERYGEEFLLYMQDSFGPEKAPVPARLSVAAGGLRERARRSGMTGDSAPVHERVRAGMLTVLVSWAAMVAAGASFAKMSEHFDSALTAGAGARHLADLAYTAVQAGAFVAAAVLGVAAALALPSFVRYLRANGWRELRGHALRALGCTLLAGGLTIALSVWAHHLDSYQRNGGSGAYTALFLSWGALMAVTVAMWTVLAAACARRVTLSRLLLATEAAFAVAVAAATVVIFAATVLWWAAMAEHAPSFLSGDPSLPLSGQLVATVALMALSAAVAAGGAVRIGRCLPAWRNR